MTVPSKHPQQFVLEVLSSLSYRTGELSSYLHEVAQGVSELMQLVQEGGNTPTVLQAESLAEQSR
ncbi:MAG: hypothetical protein LH647_23015 [Leptolyngbyaceae cyanobacterium CAN_BIN12]|nr:hypothetical protein [Leptolyngbyaceae cyanobacterium CAN_BIN12]